MFKQKRKVILFSLLAVVISIMCLSCGPKTKAKILEELNNGEYSQVVNDINNLSGPDKQEVQMRAVELIPNIKESVANGSLDYTKAINDLNYIKEIIPNENKAQATDAINYVKNIQVQHKAT